MDEIDEAMEQLDRLLNDPSVAMQPDLVWALTDRLSRRAKHPNHPAPPR